MKTVLFLIGLLLALYGLSCCITSFVLWLTGGGYDQENSYVIPVSNEKTAKIKIAFNVERLKNCGMKHITKIIIVDCGLPLGEKEGIQKHCKKKGLLFCEKEKLANYL